MQKTRYEKTTGLSESEHDLCSRMNNLRGWQTASKNLGFSRNQAWLAQRIVHNLHPVIAWVRVWLLNKPDFFRFFFNCLGCSFFCEDHAQFHIFIRNSRYDLFHIYSLHICCRLFLISGNFCFPFVSTSLGYITNLPKNKRKTKITRDEKSTATYICSYFETRPAAAP